VKQQSTPTPNRSLKNVCFLCDIVFLKKNKLKKYQKLPEKKLKNYYYSNKNYLKTPFENCGFFFFVFFLV